MSEDHGLPHWRKSSFSMSGDCVEWLELPDRVLVRDSKDSNGPVLSFTRREWAAFVQAAASGEASLRMSSSLGDALG